MATILIVTGVVLALGVGAYFLLRQPPEEPQLPEATPEPSLPEPAPEPEPLVILDPLTGEPLQDDYDTISVPLRHELAPGFRASKRLRVNRTTARDYRKFGIKFFRTTAGDMNCRGSHCYYEDDFGLSTLEMYLLFELMFGDDCYDDECFDGRYDELEGYYDEDPLAYDNEAAVRQFEMMDDEGYVEVTEEDIIEEEFFVGDEVTEPNIDMADVVAVAATAELVDGIVDEMEAEDAAVAAVAAEAATETGASFDDDTAVDDAPADEDMIDES